MKKPLILFLALLIMFSITFHPQGADAKRNIKVYADGERVQFDVQPQNIKGRVMIPVRHTIEFLNAKVLWSNKEKKVTILQGDKRVEFKINEKEIKVNGKVKKIDTPAIIHQSRTMVPVRFLVEAFGYHVTWRSAIDSVVISTNSFIYPQDEINIPVLMYHHFSDTVKTNATISPAEFQNQMEHLKALGYETITNQDLVDFMKGKKTLPEKVVMITMDDGYESNYNVAYPVLNDLNMKATIYVIGSKIRESNASPYPANEIPKLSWEQAKEMYDAGVMDIQNHTYDMHQKSKGKNGKYIAEITGPIYQNGRLETKAEYEKRVKEDLLRNKSLIEEKVGNKVIGFAYPFGSFSTSSEKLLKETGHQLSLTVKPGMNKRGDGAFLLHRINVPPGMSGKDLEKKINQYVK